METTVELLYRNNHGSMSKQNITFLKGAYDTIPFSQNEIDDLKCKVYYLNFVNYITFFVQNNNHEHDLKLTTDPTRSMFQNTLLCYPLLHSGHQQTLL